MHILYKDIHRDDHFHITLQEVFFLINICRNMSTKRTDTHTHLYSSRLSYHVTWSFLQCNYYEFLLISLKKVTQLCISWWNEASCICFLYFGGQYKLIFKNVLICVFHKQYYISSYHYSDICVLCRDIITKQIMF